MLSIIRFIKEYGLAEAILKFKLKTRVYQQKILLKYDQLESDMSLPEVQDCRGLILEKDTWKVMAMSFFKFFNAFETNAAVIDWNTAIVLDKIDGCLEKNTIIITDKGEKTIQEICESKFDGNVLSFDVINNNFVFDKIVGYSIQNNINNWYEIELIDARKIRLTGNHRVWLPKLNCYRKVADLTIEDEFLITKKD